MPTNIKTVQASSITQKSVAVDHTATLIWNANNDRVEVVIRNDDAVEVAIGFSDSMTFSASQRKLAEDDVHIISGEGLYTGAIYAITEDTTGTTISTDEAILA